MRVVSLIASALSATTMWSFCHVSNCVQVCACVNIICLYFINLFIPGTWARHAAPFEEWGSHGDSSGLSSWGMHVVFATRRLWSLFKWPDRTHSGRAHSEWCSLCAFVYWGPMRVFIVLRDIDVSFEKCMLLLKSMYVYLSICYMPHFNRPRYKNMTC